MGTKSKTLSQGIVAPQPVDRLLRPFQEFARLESAGGILLMASAVIAMIVANTPLADPYYSLLQKKITVAFGKAGISKPLILWINDGLMAIFFLLVGLEIKREVLTGELSTRKKLALPLAAALGGMIPPALIYVVFNVGKESLSGWGIPMATDIAFALGVLSLVGRSVPIALKVFLTAFAIVDDLGAVLVIAFFYTDKLVVVALAIGLAVLALLWLLNRLGVKSAAVYLLAGLVVWVAFLKSGIHATIAGVLVAMTIPHTSRISVQDGWKDLLTFFSGKEKDHGGSNEDIAAELHTIEVHSRLGQSPLVRLEHQLHPFVMFVIMPVFALANAGVSLAGFSMNALTQPVTLGVLLGLVFGKQLGIFAFSWAAIRFKLAELPERVTWRKLYAASLLGGIGFTMSLFIANLAFVDTAFLDQAKVGILAASLVSGVVGYVVLKRG